MVIRVGKIIDELS